MPERSVVSRAESVELRSDIIQPWESTSQVSRRTLSLTRNESPWICAGMTHDMAISFLDERVDSVQITKTWNEIGN